MDQIQHKYVDAGWLKLHVTEIGTGPSVVVFLHGFPEIWYSWRHQMIAAANAGYRALAPDFRGYGLSEVPPEPEKASFHDILQDLLAILDSFAIAKVLEDAFPKLNECPRPTTFLHFKQLILCLDYTTMNNLGSYML